MAIPVSMLLKLNGIPAHPLIVHGAVVLGPLAVLAALVYLVPSWRDRVRWPLLVAALLAVAFIWAAYLTGNQFKDSEPYFNTGPLAAQIEKHESYAGVLRWITTAFAVVAVVVTAWLHRRRDALRVVASGVLGVLAVATLVYIVLTGDAGAKAVFPPDQFKDAAPAAVGGP